MKSLTSWVIVGFLLLTTTQNHASSSKNKFPEAYAGLNQNAYHEITVNKTKSNDIGFELDGIQVTIQANHLKVMNQIHSNVSFTQSIPNGFISATMGHNSLFGELHLNNKHYILTTNHSGIWAVELPNKGLSFNDCGFDHEQQNINQKLNQITLDNINAQHQHKEAGTIIDVLVVYDQAIAERYPGDLLQTRVDQYFNVSNQTYANSDIDLAIRQVGLEQVGYDLNNANLTARNLIQRTLQTGAGIQGFEELPQIKNQTGADLVIFLRTHDIETRGNCGIAFFPVSDDQNNFDPSYGVNIMADGMSSWSVCTDQLMVHEIGHNLGAGHHNATVNQRFIPDAAGFARLGQFGTVMGSFGTGNPDRFFELNYFSNPSVRCGGGNCGIAGDRNNANVINQLKGPVSGYNSNVSGAPNPQDFSLAVIDQDNDGILDQDDEFPFDPRVSQDSDRDGVGNAIDAFPNLASEQSDFDGDGIGNNADNDDDNDGILDIDDDFPLNNEEVKDSDGDGVGDIADVFVFNPTEYADFDQDGTGNNTDEDDDNDGVIDLSPNQQDLLVISVENNRILRFDAQTGLPKGIEVLPDDGLLTFQSDLSYDEASQQLFFSTQSSIKTLDMMDLNAEPLLVAPPFAETANALNTGFPTALQIYQSNSLYLAKLNANRLYNHSTVNFRKPNFEFVRQLPNDVLENVIDFESYNGELYTLGQNTRVYRGDPNCCEMIQVGDARMNWLVDPYAFAITETGQLLHTDQNRNRITRTNGQTGEFEGVFVNLNDLGFSNPTGIDITEDGRVLVAVSDQNSILEFNLESAEFLGSLVNGQGLDSPHKITLVPQLVDRFHQDENKVIRPNAGNWFNPATSGRGFNIGIFENRLQVLWFTYDELGLPIWYTSAGLLDGFSYQADLLKTNLDSQGEFSFETIGQIEIDFNNERQANISWQIGNVTGAESIIWLQSSGEPEINDYTGMWSRPDTPGWGVAVSTNGEVNFAIPFIYDASGEPRWTISDVFTGTTPLSFDMDTIFSEGLCPTCSGEISTIRIPSGSMNLNLNDDANWSSAIIWADPIPGTWDLDETEIIRISSEPTRPR